MSVFGCVPARVMSSRKVKRVATPKPPWVANVEPINYAPHLPVSGSSANTDSSPNNLKGPPLVPHNQAKSRPYVHIEHQVYPQQMTAYRPLATGNSAMNKKFALNMDCGMLFQWKAQQSPSPFWLAAKVNATCLDPESRGPGIFRLQVFDVWERVYLDLT